MKIGLQIYALSCDISTIYKKTFAFVYKMFNFIPLF